MRRPFAIIGTSRNIGDARPSVPLGRMSPNMQATQVAEKLENKQKQVRAQESNVQSRFNDAEYERWSQNLRNKNRGKNT